MFLRARTRKKDGKEHRYWSIVENKRLSDGRVQQRHVLYLGEINSSQELAWRKSIEVLEERQKQPQTLALFPEDRCEGLVAEASVVRLRLSELRLCRPRQWGACWLALRLWQELRLDEFWSGRLEPSRKGTRWEQVLFVLVAYRLISPGSEWRLYREWFERSALANLLGADAALSDIHNLYACHDRLLDHKEAFFSHLVGRWRDLFNASFEVLLYDLTSTYFECDVPQEAEAKRRFGYSPESPLRLRASGHCIGGHPRWLTVGLRSVSGQHRGQDGVARFRALSSSTVKRSGSGSWIAGSRLRRCSKRYARALHRCTIWWAHPRGG